MWDQVSRFATDRLDDLKKIGGAISNEVEYARKQLGGAYNQVDEAVDGALPGGTKQSAVGRTIKQLVPKTTNQTSSTTYGGGGGGGRIQQADTRTPMERAPVGQVMILNGKKGFKNKYGEWQKGTPESDPVTQRANEIEEVMGVRPNIVDPTKNKTFGDLYAKAMRAVGRWDVPDSANTYTNTMYMNNYKPGENPLVETHEAGHLSFEEAGLPRFLGVAGRWAGRGLSEKLGNPPLLDLLSGGLMYTMDAEEEDRAERLTAKYGEQLGADPSLLPEIDAQGRSSYGNSLREEGKARMLHSFRSIIDPIQTAANTFIEQKANQNRSNLKPQIADAVKRYRAASAASDDVTPELVKITKELSSLREQYGPGVKEFIKTIPFE